MLIVVLLVTKIVTMEKFMVNVGIILILLTVLLQRPCSACPWS